MKKSVKVETLYSIGEWLPELLCLVTDLLIPLFMGYGDSVGGISVAGIVMGALSRLTRSVNSVIKIQAIKVEGRKRSVVLGNLWWTLLCAVFISIVMFLSRDLIEEATALPGIAEYMVWGPWYWLLFRLSVTGAMPIGISQVGMAKRVALSWISCALNVVLTYSFVKEYGVRGSSLATLISTIPGTVLFLVWAIRGGYIGKPTLHGIAEIWPMAKERLKGEGPSLLNSFTALQLNSWMGPGMAATWSLMHLACDVAGGLGMVIWSISGKHLTFFVYGEGKDEEKGWAAWNWGDRIAISAQVGGAIVAYFLVPYAVLIIIAYALNKRFKYLIEAKGTRASEMRIKEAKYAWSTSCIVGYWLCMSLIAPTIIVPTIVYCVAATGSICMMTRK